MKTLQQLLTTKIDQTVISISPNQVVFDALEIMAKHHIGALAVIDHEKLVGIFSERDYTREMELKGRNSKTTKIHEVMTNDVHCAAPEDSVESAMSLMSDRRVRHLPVIQDNKMIGILSIGDLVKETIAYQQDLIKQLETYINS